jgi:predicted enzyme related to lactoylglutathione lyase
MSPGRDRRLTGMTTRDTAPPGAPCWIDLLSSDTDATRAFYGELFGWKSEEAGEEYGGYINFSLHDRPIAGLMGKTPEMGEMPDGWSIYFRTDDVHATCAAAVDHGGTVGMPPMPIPADGHLGHMAMISDPSGGFFGLWQPGEHIGFGLWDETGAPSWFELHTTGYDAALDFYRAVLGWRTTTVADSPEFRYTQLVDPADGETGLAGVMDASGFLPDGVPSHWSVYLGVDDADAVVARAAELGGSVVMAPEDTPYGRLATLTDATGAGFKIVQPPADR